MSCRRDPDSVPKRPPRVINGVATTVVWTTAAVTVTVVWTVIIMSWAGWVVIGWRDAAVVIESGIVVVLEVAVVGWKTGHDGDFDWVEG